MAMAILRTQKTLLTRTEVARALSLSPHRWDKLRKEQEFTEFHIFDGPKGLRFIAAEIEAYIRMRIEKHSAVN